MLNQAHQRFVIWVFISIKRSFYTSLPHTVNPFTISEPWQDLHYTLLIVNFHKRREYNCYAEGLQLKL